MVSYRTAVYLQGNLRTSGDLGDEGSRHSANVALDVGRGHILNRSIAGELASNAVRNRRLVGVRVGKVAG